MIDLTSIDALSLTLHHSPGVQAVLLGSGLSRAAGIPTGWEITVDLIRRLAALDGVTEHDSWPSWYRAKFAKEPSYSEILDALASTPAERRAILQSYIDAPPDQEARQPTKAHHAIARLVRDGAVRVIITTNFDRLLENALRAAGVEPTVIASEDAVAGAAPLVHSRCTVIKVHGDYLDARIKNTDAELATYGPAIDRLLDQVLDNFGLLIVGWSGDWDLALRSAILRAPNRRYPCYWAARGAPSALAQDIVDQRSARVISIAGADEFFEQIENTAAGLRAASGPHPQSVEAALALAKRLCRDDRFAMEWAEFLHEQVTKFREFAQGPEYNKDSPTDASLTELLHRLVSRSEVLRRSFMVCGRWGTVDANRTLRRILSALSLSEEDQGGYVYLTQMKKFAASISFYWASAGLMEADRWTEFRQLMFAEISYESKRRAAASILPFTAYDSVNWKFIAGLENQYTPISDFLVTLFKADAASELMMTPQHAEDSFDLLEINIALGFAHVRLEEMKKNDGLWFWMPVGRFMWRRRKATLDGRLQEIQEMPAGSPYLKAGMMRGTPHTAAEIIAAVRDHLSKIAGRYW